MLRCNTAITPGALSLEKNMEIKEYQTYNEQEIIDLYQSVGWTNYTSCPEMLEKAYKNSLCILGAFEKEKLVGVVRVVGDGISIVFVQDILVLPEYQRQGVGSALMRAILKNMLPYIRWSFSRILRKNQKHSIHRLG